MTSTMVRSFAAAAVAVAALGGVVGIAGTAANAAPSTNPFAGTFVSHYQPFPTGSWAITIGASGGIKGSGEAGYLAGALAGKVTEGGAMSVTMKWSWPGGNGSGHGGIGPTRLAVASSSETHTATVTLDESGNILGIDDSGNSFTWDRQ